MEVHIIALNCRKIIIIDWLCNGHYVKVMKSKKFKDLYIEWVCYWNEFKLVTSIIMKCTIILDLAVFIFLQVMASSVFVLLVSLDVVVKLTLMNVHLSLVTMVQVVWIYPRDIVASVRLVSYIKIIILNLKLLHYTPIIFYCYLFESSSRCWWHQ